MKKLFVFACFSCLLFKIVYSSGDRLPNKDNPLVLTANYKLLKEIKLENKQAIDIAILDYYKFSIYPFYLLSNNKLYYYDGNGVLLKQIGDFGSSKERLNNPLTISNASFKKILINDSGNNRIILYDNDSDYFEIIIDNYGMNKGQILNSLGCIERIDKSIVVWDKNRVQIFDSNYNFLFGLGFSFDKAYFLDNISDVMVDYNQNIWILARNKLYKYGYKGMLLAEKNLESNFKLGIKNRDVFLYDNEYLYFFDNKLNLRLKQKLPITYNRKKAVKFLNDFLYILTDEIIYIYNI